MASAPRQFLLTPVGRLVAGSLYKAQDTDSEGRPLLIKNGPNAGKPRVEYFFALAIPKQGEQHWARTPWGRTIYEVGAAAFPNGQTQSPTFAWKITDGDSTIPNSTGKKPCEREGYPGHWVLAWSSGFAPKIFNADGTQQIVEPDAVKLGYYIQVHGSVDGNESAQKPGVYLNHSMVALSAYGPEIIIGPDAKSVGFGAGVQLPAGAMATPQAGGFNPAAPGGALPPLPGAAPAGLPPLPGVPGAPPMVVPALPSTPVPSPVAAPVLPASPSLPQVPVAPHPQFLQVPATSAGPQMTAKANGATYEQLRSVGWTDELLRQHGMMV